MLSSRQAIVRTPIARYFQSLAARAVGSSTVPTNDPLPTKTVQNVSETNALPTSSTGNVDAALQESAEVGERQRVRQAPNRDGIWSRSQQERSKAMVGPRFEQTIMEYQVRAPIMQMDMNHICPPDPLCCGASEADCLFFELHLASTMGSYRPHPSTTCSVDEREVGVVRWWRWSVGSSQDFHESGPAGYHPLYLLWASFCKF